MSDTAAVVVVAAVVVAAAVVVVVEAGVTAAVVTEDVVAAAVTGKTPHTFRVVLSVLRLSERCLPVEDMVDVVGVGV